MIAELDRLTEISLQINSMSDLDSLIDFVHLTIVDWLECEDTFIILFDEVDQQHYFLLASDGDQDEIEKVNLELDGTVAGAVFDDQAPMVINNVAVQTQGYRLVFQDQGYFIDNLLCVPLFARGLRIGVLQATNKTTGNFTDADLKFLAYIGAQVATAILNIQVVSELQDANQLLLQTDKLKADFMAVASHELRTPLGIILGYTTFLKEETEGELSEHADTVLKSALHLRSLLEDMTNMNLLYTGAAELRKKVISIQDLVQFAVDELSQQADDHTVELHVTMSFDDIYVRADDRLRKVFINLLDNAIQFSPQPGRVDMRVVVLGDEVVVEVSDEGIGIPADKLEQVFEQFYQIEGHMTRHHEGLGLGLAIARGMVELHGGRIWAESDGPGKGSTFRVALPVYFPN